jgi:hypothetical protein
VAGLQTGEFDSVHYGFTMSVDTHGLTPEHVGKRLHLELTCGEVLQIRLHEMTVCATPEPCCGITYILLATNRGDGSRETGNAYWTAFDEIKNFDLLGD